MTAIVGMALGKRPIQQPSEEASTTANFLLASGQSSVSLHWFSSTLIRERDPFLRFYLPSPSPKISGDVRIFKTLRFVSLKTFPPFSYFLKKLDGYFFFFAILFLLIFFKNFPVIFICTLLTFSYLKIIFFDIFSLEFPYCFFSQFFPSIFGHFLVVNLSFYPLILSQIFGIFFPIFFFLNGGKQLKERMINTKENDKKNNEEIKWLRHRNKIYG